MKEKVTCSKSQLTVGKVDLNCKAENTIEQVGEIVRFASKPKFLATIAGSTASQVAVGHFKLDGFTSNADLFDSDNGRFKLKGIEILIGDGSQKLEAVEKMLKVHGIIVY